MKDSFRKCRQQILVLVLASFAFSVTAIAQVAVTTFHYDNSRMGADLQEQTLTPANVNVNSFGKVFSYNLPLDSYVYGQPLYLPNVSVPGFGTRNVVYVATQHDKVFAFDADGNSPGQLWVADLAQRVGGTPPTTYPPATADLPHAGFIAPTVGIMGTPVIDSTAGVLYVVAKTKEGTAIVDRLHALDVGSGADLVSSTGVVVQASVPGMGTGSVGGMVSFDARTANQRPGLLLSSGVLYIAWGAFEDTPHYHGWVLAYSPSNLQLVAAFNTTPDGGNFSCAYLQMDCNGEGGGVWSTGALASDASGDVFAGSGNGTFSGDNYSQAFMRLQSGTVSLLDYFIPFNADDLNAQGLDVAGGMMLPPDLSGSHTHVEITAGKEGKIYVIDRDNMGGFDPTTDHVVQTIPNAVGGPGCHDPSVSDGCARTTPAYWNGFVYFHGQRDYLKVYSLDDNGQLTFFAQGPTYFVNRGASPVISANNTNNAIVWELRVDDPSYSGSDAILHAYRADDVTQELYNTTQRSTDSPGKGENFIVPIVANGRVYVAARAQLAAYGLLN